MGMANKDTTSLKEMGTLEMERTWEIISLDSMERPATTANRVKMARQERMEICKDIKME